MQSTSTTYNNILATANHYFEVKLNIAGDDYEQDVIFAAKSDSKLFDNEPTIGGTYSGTLEFSLLGDGADIPKMAAVKPYFRAVSGGSTSAWYQKGLYYIDTRSVTHNDSGLTTFTAHCFDAMLKANAPYANSSLNWPAVDTAVVGEIATMMGITTDSRNTAIMNKSYSIPLPTSYTMRDVLSYIGAMYGANWCISDEGKLRIVPIGGSGDTLAVGKSCSNLNLSPVRPVYTQVIYEVDEETAIVSGSTDTHVMEAYCPIGSQTAADRVLTTLSAWQYRPFDAVGCWSNPAVEVGDQITVNGESGTIYSRVISFGNGMVMDLSAPNDNYIDHEYTYESPEERRYARTISGMSTEIANNAEAITLRATKTEAQGYASDAEAAAKSYADSQITVKAGEILSTVSANAAVVNLLPSVYYRENVSGKTWEDHGVTWTVNNDGSVTATGTATGANSDYYLSSSVATDSVPWIIVDPTKKHTISGGINSNAYIAAGYISNPGDTWAWATSTSSATGTAAIPLGAKYLRVFLRIAQGYAIPTGGVTFFPMLEVGDTAHSYVSTHNGTGALEKRMVSAESAIVQNANDITLKVSESDVTGNYVIGKINLSSTTATIAAEHINLQGAVSISSFNNATQAALLTGTAVKNQYYISTSSSSATGGTWSDTTAAWSSGKYVWTRVVATKTYADGTSTTTNGTAVYDENLTSALSTATTAASDASTAITNAGTAQTTANTAIANTPIVNLLPSVYRREATNGSTWTYNGITWVVNADGSVTASGTASANSDYNLSYNDSSAPVPWIPIDATKKHTLSGVPSVAGCLFRVAVYNSSGTGIGTFDIDGGSQTSRTIAASANYRYAYAYLRITSGTAITSGVTFYPMFEVGDTAHAYVSTHSGSGAIMAKTIASTVSCYYRSTTSTTPTISTSTSIGTAADTSNAWEYVMPRPKNGCYFFTCERYTHGDGSVTFSTVRQLANATYTSLWCSSADSTYIDGGQIYTGTVNANAIKANETFTQTLYAQDFRITGGSVNITTSEYTQDVIILASSANNALKLSSNSISLYNTYRNNEAISLTALYGADGSSATSGIVSGFITIKSLNSTSTTNRSTRMGAGYLDLYNGGDPYNGGVIRAAMEVASDGYGYVNLSDGTGSVYIRPSGASIWRNTSSTYSALIWPDSNGAGRFVLGDGTSTLWRTQLDNTGLTFRNSSDAVTASYPADGIGGVEMVEILNKIDLPQTFTSYACNWQDYGALVLMIGTYGNIVQSINISKSWFSTTTSGTRVLIYYPTNTSIYFEVYQNGNGYVYAKVSTSAANYRLRIYGVRAKY